MNLADRNIVFTDLEATGLDFNTHEIIEIGAVITDHNLKVLDEIDIKVLPKHLNTASEDSLRIAGYEDSAWKDASTLESALQLYAAKTNGAIFAAHNPTFDWPFLAKAFAETRIAHTIDYHRIDTFSLAWKALQGELDEWGDEAIAKHLGIKPEPKPHRAINGAHLTFEIYKRLMQL